MEDKFKHNFKVVNLARHNVPIITEDTKTRQNWVPVGIYEQDDYFPLIEEAYQTSTTNAACIEGIADLIYGEGIYTKNLTFEETLKKIINGNDARKAAFDLKLFGNSAFQVVWNDDHTQVVRIYHTPIQTLRAEKIYGEPQIQNYFYCHNWYDQKAVKNKKKIPAFGTSKEKIEIFYLKGYTPGKYYYSLPDWISAFQFAQSEAELSNLHLNNIENGFLPLIAINLNNGVPPIEERDIIEDQITSKFTGTRNAGRFLITFNDDPINQPVINAIQTENLHEKYQYVAKYAQDRILVAHRITSPLLFGIRTEVNGFSSNADEMAMAFSILQSMTIVPFQNLLLSGIEDILESGGWEQTDLYVEQIMPLSIVAQQSAESGQTTEEIQNDVNEQSQVEDAESVIDSTQQLSEDKYVRRNSAFFKRDYE
jgi:hypothetical protein